MNPKCHIIEGRQIRQMLPATDNISLLLGRQNKLWVFLFLKKPYGIHPTHDLFVIDKLTSTKSDGSCCCCLNCLKFSTFQVLTCWPTKTLLLLKSASNELHPNCQGDLETLVLPMHMSDSLVPNYHLSFIKFESVVISQFTGCCQFL